MCLNVTLKDDTIEYALTNLEEPLGWMAVGWGDRMPQTHMAVLWPNTDGTVTLSQRFARGHMEPRLENRPPRIASIPEIKASWIGTTTLSFIVPREQDAENTTTPLTPGIIAFSPFPPASADPSVHILAHTGTGHVHLVFSDEGEAVEDTDDVSDESTPAQSHVADRASTSRLLALHGALMTLAFGILFPMGALVARLTRTSTRSWIVAHKALQMYAGAPAVVLGLTAAIGGVGGRGARHIHDSHQVVGVLLVTLYVVQVGLGVYIHGRPKVVAHPVRNIAHVALGLGVVGLGLAQVRSGLHEWDSHMPSMMVSDWAYPMHGAWVALCVLLYVVGFCLLPRQFAQERASKSEGAMGKEYVPLQTGQVERGEGRPIIGDAGNSKVRDERGDAVSDNEDVRIPLLRGE
ncbi:hypothetical protein K523DRAFT_256669 [Schizophyllum commune Tattone D]|nr:hypothetical protein K523DRAFT_256669 [Schizophyllum commune Tattone D]